MHPIIRGLPAIVLLAVAGLAGTANAQPFGIELHNTMMPIAGGMGGVSIAQPLEPLSAINGNPAALTRFDGTQFQFGGGWAESTFNMRHTGNLVLAGVSPYAAKSGTPGTAVTNIGMTRQLNIFDGNVVAGFGLTSDAGVGIDFRDVPASNGTSSQIVVLDVSTNVGVKLTERLSVGSTLGLGSSFFSGPFVGISSMVPDYALRGTLGVNYDVFDATTLGFYYQTKQNFTYDDAIRFALPGNLFSVAQDVSMSLPANFGFGIANRGLCDGRLMLGMDVLLKNWDDAALFNAVYKNQLVFQFGAQYSINRLRLRAGYTYAENPLKQITSTEVGGVVPPAGLPAVEYLQAQFAVINRNRISFGIGMADVLPGLDVDFFAGGMFRESADIGAFTSVNVESYWVGLGSTYRFGRMTPRK